MRRWLALAVLIVAIGGGVFAWSMAPGRPGVALAAPPPAGQALVAPVAADGSAPLVAPISEVTPAMKEARRFNRYDKDKDGEITRLEYFVARRKAFAKLDLDGDGKLGFDEYSAKAEAKFATADADHSNKLLPVEFATTAVKHRVRAPANCPPVVAAERDADSDREG